MMNIKNVENVEKGRPIPVPNEKKQTFKALTETPAYSWPAILLAVLVISSVIFTDILALSGQLSLTVACLIVSFIYYWYFSVIHDSVHRTLCKNKKLNDFIGQAAFSAYAPYAALPILRWGHMEHHRFTNGEEDPDSFTHGSPWSLPFRWIVIDFYYAYRLFTSDHPQAKKVRNESLPYVIGGVLLIAGIIASGYLTEYLLLWFIPSRIAFIGIGFSFFWLPHAHWPNDKHDVRQTSNFTLATTVRIGKEWLLNPLLQYQNYHLIHHLWPTTPFYNNVKVWNLLESELKERDLAIADGFTIQPEFKITNS